MICSKVRTRLTSFLKHSCRLSQACRMSSGQVDELISHHDKSQVGYLNEQCLLVSEKDEIVGSASKKKCHLLDNIEKGMLHRAFSVFLFNSRNELLLQKRSKQKITYPDHWTNTCCSHPLDRPGERGGVEGARAAAVRKLQHELGINQGEVPPESLHYLTRIHYQSRNSPDDGVFGEHEIDYILIAKRDVALTPNPNEVQDIRYVTREQLRTFIADSEKNGVLLTPWFRMIAEHKLFSWWADLDDLARHEDHSTIHRLVTSKRGL